MAGAEAQLVVSVAGKELRYGLGQLGTVDDSVTTTGERSTRLSYCRIEPGSIMLPRLVIR
ncbi:hypothetical protein CKW46_07125 [Mycobacterium liflandii]|nr:hypothetical protein BB170200_03794 [Mycobacterium marinum]ULL09502.1 hypothetical protein CKW46_07125 [Mycobacterium liflandii]